MVRTAQPGEPIIEVGRFVRACNRLAVLRDMKDVPNRLQARLLRRFRVINYRMDGVNYRMFYMDTEE